MALLLTLSTPVAATLVIDPNVQKIDDDWKFQAPISVVVSGDGAYAYVAASGSQTINVFTRNAADGLLSFVTTTGAGSYVASLVLSPDGNHLYATLPLAHGLVVFARDSLTGTLTLVATYYDNLPGTSGFSDIAVSPDGAQVYAVDRAESSVVVFARNAGTGELTLIDKEIDGIGGVDGLYVPESIAISGDGAHVVAGGNFDDALAVFARDPMSGSLTFVGAQFDGAGGVTGLDQVQSVAISPGSEHVYACGTALVAFGLDALTGALSYVETEAPLPPGFGACRVTVTPDGAHVLLTRGSTLAVYARDGLTGALTLVDSEADGVGGVDFLSQAYRPAVSPDGTQVYVPSADDYAVSIFDRNALTGQLTLSFVELGGGGLDGARGGAVSPDGKNLYVAAFTADSIMTFDRDTGTGLLTMAGRTRDGYDGVDGLDGAARLAVSPDGAHLYASGEKSDAIAVFSRDALTGALTFASVVHDGIGGVDGLDAPAGIAISGDGAHVYVAGRGEDAIAVFARSPLSGALSFVHAVRNGVGGVSGLGGVQALALSPDGAFLYAAGFDDNAVSVFSRNTGSGALTFVAALVDDVGGVDGLHHAASLAVSPDGDHLYVAGDGVAMFARDAVTGLLTWLGVVRNGDTAPLGQMAVVAITPDGRGVYAGPFYLLRRDPATGLLTYVESRGGGNDAVISPDGRNIYSISGPPMPRTIVGYDVSSVTVQDLVDLCRPSPASICRSSQRATLLLKDRPGTKNDRMRFRWTRGDDTQLSAFGDPRYDNSAHAVCIYDQTGGVPTLRLEASAPAEEACQTRPPFFDNCWEATPWGFIYLDGLGTPEGLAKATLRAGGAGKARLMFTGKGANLAVPSLPLVPPVTIQTVNVAGECWGATFAADQILANTTTPTGSLFKSRK